MIPRYAPGDGPESGVGDLYDELDAVRARLGRYEDIAKMMCGERDPEALLGVCEQLCDDSRERDRLKLEADECLDCRDRDRRSEALERIAAYPEIPHLEKYADWAEVRRIAREALS